ncbi:MAG TPA: hypothetical protein EYP98_10690 [Planctomycetes bacterium]|nr:hypothetical protein [Planctomycetota bacterium]
MAIVTGEMGCEIADERVKHLADHRHRELRRLANDVDAEHAPRQFADAFDNDREVLRVVRLVALIQQSSQASFESQFATRFVLQRQPLFASIGKVPQSRLAQ